MSLVYLTNKKNGTSHVYESINYWAKDKKQSHSKRVCIGKLDEAENLIPSKRLAMSPALPHTKQGPVPPCVMNHS